MEKIFISFSGGRSSALTTRILVERYGIENCIILFANTGKENEATYDFVINCSEKWGYPITWIEGTYQKYEIHGGKSQRDCIGFKVVDKFSFRRINSEHQDLSIPFQEMIQAFKMIPNRQARFCTEYLKIIPMEKYLKSIGLNSYITAIGIRFDEPHRVAKHPDKLLPLNDYEVTKPMVLEWWKKQDFDLKLKEHQGNCDLCILKSERKIKTILRETPQVSDWYRKIEYENSSSFFGKPIVKLIELSKNKFRLYREGEYNQIPLFGQDLEISCFCGD